MAEKEKKEEKFYTPKEVAAAVLKKAQELLKNHLAKANSSHEVEAGEEPNNDEAEAPEYLANADIEDSGAHGEKKSKKSKKGLGAADKDGDGDIDGDDAIAMADKDGDGDIDGDDAIEAEEEASGEDLDGDNEAGEPKEHKEKVKAAAKAPEDKDVDEKIDAASKDKSEKKQKPPFMKSEKGVHEGEDGKSVAGEKIRQAKTKGPKGEAYLKGRAKDEHKKKLGELKEMDKPDLPKSEHLAKDMVSRPDAGFGAVIVKDKNCDSSIDLKKPALKKFMLRRKMKKAEQFSKSAGPTAASRIAEKLSGAAPAPIPQEKIKEQPSPNEKVKAQPKQQMEKNKETEKLLGIKPKAGK